MIHKIEDSILQNCQNEFDISVDTTHKLAQRIKRFKDIKDSQSYRNSKKEKYMKKIKTDRNVLKINEFKIGKIAGNKDLMKITNEYESSAYLDLGLKIFSRRKNKMARGYMKRTEEEIN